MLTKLEQSQQQWAGIDLTIDNWLNDRKAVLVAYCELAGLPPFQQKETALPSTLDIKRFCQVLMDYISAGHFEIFENIVKKNGKCVETAKKIQTKINLSTDVALNFNDHFADLHELTEMSEFDQQLSVLGGFLEQRFDLEDQLIQIVG